jgi:hypothetical protein
MLPSLAFGSRALRVLFDDKRQARVQQRHEEETKHHNKKQHEDQSCIAKSQFNVTSDQINIETFYKTKQRSETTLERKKEKETNTQKLTKDHKSNNMDDFIDSSLPAWTTVAATAAATCDDGSTSTSNNNNNTNNSSSNRRQQLHDKIQTQLTSEKLQKRKQQAGNALKNFGSQLQKINLVRLLNCCDLYLMSFCY